MEALTAATTKLVDRGLAPEAAKRVLPGIPSALLPGHPSEGGFGCLPWGAHILRRHAVWGARLITRLAAGVSPQSPLWVQTAHALLLRCGGGRADSGVRPIVAPLLALIAAAHDGPGILRVVAGQPSLPPGPLHRMVMGLRALHPGGMRAYDISDAALTPGPWCAAMPLWGNPLLAARPSNSSGGPGSTIDAAFGDLQVIPSLRTVGDAFRIALAVHDADAQCSVQQLWGERAHRYLMQHVWRPERIRCGLLGDVFGEMSVLVADRDRVHTRLAALCASLPPEWLKQCRSSTTDAVEAAAATIMPMIVSRLGWRCPVPPAAGRGVIGKPVSLTQLTVRSGTQLQLGPTAQARHAQHRAYASLAMELPHDRHPPPTIVRGLASTLSSAWRLKWENAEKEVLWRMTVDGVAGANGRVTFKCPGCPGSGLGEARVHAFWECPVAAAVRSTIEAALSPQAPVICRSSVWLCRAPKSVHVGVWQVVCMAAVSAMHHGRRQLWRLVKEAEKRRDAANAAAAAAAARRQQHTLLELWHTKQQINLPALVARAARYAVSDFWGRLASFAALGLAPESWLALVGASHPFLCMGGRQLNLGAAGICSKGHGGRDELQFCAAAVASGPGCHALTDQHQADETLPAIQASFRPRHRDRRAELVAMWAAVGVTVPSSGALHT